MNLQKTIIEIGLLEIVRVVSRFAGRGVDSPFLPVVVPDEMERHIFRLSDEVLALKKNILFLMTPEIALLEALKNSNWDGDVVIAIPHDAGEESADRIRANMPRGLEVRFLNEGQFPDDFYPDNGALLCAGFAFHGTHYRILPSSYRMMSLYKQFAGRKVFMSAFPEGADLPELGWVSAAPDFFTSQIGMGEDWHET